MLPLTLRIPSCPVIGEKRLVRSKRAVFQAQYNAMSMERDISAVGRIVDVDQEDPSVQNDFV